MRSNPLVAVSRFLFGSRHSYIAGVCALLLIASGSKAASLTPIIGMEPSSLDFGSIVMPSCADLSVSLGNDAEDPLSILTVTAIAIEGDGFSILTGPSLPVSIPGDQTTILVTLRFCPTESGLAMGTLTISAPGAANSPCSVPLYGDGSGEEAGFVEDRFLIDFAPNALVPAGVIEGPLDAFQFNAAGLRDALLQAGVIRLRKLLPSFTSEDVRDSTLSGEPVRLHDMSRVYVAELRSHSSVPPAVALLRNRAGVGYVEPDYIYRADYVPNDPLYSKEWGLNNTAQLGAGFVIGQDINGPEAWTIFDPTFAMGGGTPVAILDTGVFVGHDDLKDNDGQSRVFPEANFTQEPHMDTSPHSHGTAVAGIIGCVSHFV